jgi:type II secretory pathway pseudopilin PulG
MKFKVGTNKRAADEATAGGFGVSRRSSRAAGFTLAEVMAAMVFMAILIPVALEGLSIASRAGEVAVRKTEASLVAERILNEMVATTNWNRSSQSGTVRQGARDFRWNLRNDAWNQDSSLTTMRLLSVEVVFAAQGHDYTVRMSTLVDSATPLTTQTSTQQ